MQSINSSNYAIVADKVSYSYGNQLALEEVSFTIEKGDFVGIIGPNGGGKTTLLRLMLGLLRPDIGTITLLGAPPLRTRNKVGYISQETSLNTTFPISVKDVILMGVTGQKGPGGRYTSYDLQKAETIIDRLGLASVKERQIGSISGGERQKALLGRALFGDPEILFLDEPTASVDASGEDEIYNHLRLLNQSGVTIVIVTHNIGVLSRYVKSVACLNRRLYFHPDGRLDEETIEKTFGCQIDLIAHGVPHRVFQKHD